MGGRGTEGHRTGDCVRFWPEGRCRQIRSNRPRGWIEPSFGRSDWMDLREKPLRRGNGDRTKTDTGRWGEYPKALERTLVKELGKMTP